jgi:uncharacterized protein YegP (UPF0339 family)
MNLTIRALAALALSLSLSTFACAAPTDAEEGPDSEETSEAFTAVKPHFELFEGKDAKIYFRLIAGNEQVVLQSQGYARKDAAQKGVASVIANGADEASYELRESAAGQHYFVLEARNGETIGQSEMYASKYSAERGVRAVRTIVLRMQREGVATAE